MTRALWLASALALTACAPTMPPGWAKGGTVLDLPRARWMRGDTVVDVTPDGKVFVDGEHEVTLDRGGRIFDLDNEPVAILEADGRLIGPDDHELGVVGAMHAALPGGKIAWLTVAPSGEVVRYDSEGDRYPYGVWVGCNGSARAHQVCTLVTHLFAMRARAMERGVGSPPVAFGGGAGVGMGFGVGIGIGH